MSIEGVAFEFRADAWVLMIGLAAGYFWALRNLGPRLSTDAARQGVERRQRRRFIAGLFVLGATVSWPIDTIGDGYLFSIHMLQYLIMSFVAAPLLVAGTPGWLLDALTEPVRPFVRRITRPVVALLTFNTVLVVSHWPGLVDVYLRNNPVHFGMHVLWVTAALIFWMPILSPCPDRYPRLSPPMQMVYLFLSSVIPTFPASFLTWAETPFYPAYAEAPRLWGISAIQDIQTAGLVMKLGGGIFLWTFITVLFFRWAPSQGNAPPRRAPATVEPAQR
ncbi:MAG: cytochrome c oxidase assembly protein [Acidimicrobiales bacterium]|nr:cytochrome c oxidase assembly protein [Acidimicrobiales bacterium]